MRLRAVLALAAASVVLAALPGGASAQPELSARIVGGGPSTTAEWPWIAYLEIEYEPGRRWSCGGSVIAPRLVLTAAHCVLNEGRVVRPTLVRGVVGRTDVRSKEGTAFNVGRIAVHPDYDRGRGFDGGPYDVAVLEADIELPAPAIALATTAEAALYAPGVVARAAGWGLTRQGGASSPVLQQVDLPIIADPDCARSDQISEAEARRMLCAGRPEGGVDTCQGDSGGPLIVPAGRDTPDPADDRWLLAGTTSWGYECAVAGRYGLYARAATFAGWVAALVAGDPAAWARATDAAAPKLRLRAARGTAGGATRLAYRVSGETGRTREAITIRRRAGGIVLRRIQTVYATNPRGRDTFVMWDIPADFAPGAYVWCASSRDQSGNRSPVACTSLRIAAAR